MQSGTDPKYEDKVFLMSYIAVIALVVAVKVVAGLTLGAAAGAQQPSANPIDCSYKVGDEKLMCVALEEIDERLCDDIGKPEKKNLCIHNIAVKKEDESICDLIDTSLGNHSKDLCVLAVAIRTDDARLCQQITRAFFKSNCVGYITEGESYCDKKPTSADKDDCLAEFAQHKEKPTICEKVGDIQKRTSCINELAKTLGDSGICELHEVGETERMCKKTVDEALDAEYDLKMMALEKMEPELCEKIVDDFEKDSCFDDMASKASDIRLCDFIGNNMKAEDCLVRENIGNLSVCDRITTGFKRDVCLLNANKALKSTKVCQQIEDAITKDDCYSHLAKTSKNLGLCDMITDDQRKRDCITKIDTQEVSPSICDGVEVADRGECIANFAVNENSTGLCDNLPAKQQSLCIQSVAVQVKNESLCSDIPDEKVKGQCLQMLASEKGDKTICSQIVDEYWKNTCYDTLNTRRKTEPTLQRQKVTTTLRYLPRTKTTTPTRGGTTKITAKGPKHLDMANKISFNCPTTWRLKSGLNSAQCYPARDERTGIYYSVGSTGKTYEEFRTDFFQDLELKKQVFKDLESGEMTVAGNKALYYESEKDGERIRDVKILKDGKVINFNIAWEAESFQIAKKALGDTLSTLKVLS